MTQYARFFDGIGYTEDQYSEVENRLLPEGIIRGVGGQLAVTAPGGMNIRIAPGEGMVQGFWFQLTAAMDIVIQPNNSGATRTDNVILRLNRVTNTVVATVVPNAPALNRTPGGDWEMLLCQVTVPNAATAPSVLTDQRETGWCGFTGQGVSEPGISPAIVGLSSKYDLNTGLLWSAPDRLEIVAGGVSALVATGTQGVTLGTDPGILAIGIGRAGQNTTINGNATVSGAFFVNQGSVFGGYVSAVGGNLDVAHNTNAAVLRVIGAANQVGIFQLISPDSARIFQMSMGNAGGYALGTVAGDVSIFTAGAGPGRLILGANGSAAMHISTGQNVNIGGLSSLPAGAGRFNVFPSSQVANSGINIYNGANYSIWTSFWQDSSGRSVMSTNAAHIMWATNGGFATFGSSPLDTVRLGVMQNAGTQTEGFALALVGTGFYFRQYVGSGGHAYLQSAATLVLVRADLAALTPQTDQGAYLGYPGTRWAIIYGGALDVSGSIAASTGTFGNNVTVNGLLTAVGGLNTNALSATTIGGTTGTFSGAVSGTSFNGDHNGNQFKCTGNMTLGIPGTANYGLQLNVDSAAKPGTSTWTVFSDPRGKYEDAYEPYLPGLTELLQFKPEWYTYNGRFNTPDGARNVGIRVAHLLETDASHMVGRSEMALEDPEIDDDDVPTHIDYHGLFMILVNSVQDLYAMIQERDREKDRRIRALETALNDRRN
jgi:hypothetical protein